MKIIDFLNVIMSKALMKYFKYYLWSTLLIIVGCKNDVNNDGYIVSGMIKGIEEGEIYTENDTIPINKGKFTLKGAVNGAKKSFFSINDQYNFSLFLTDEEFDVMIDVAEADEEGNIEDLEIHGSAINEEYKEVSEKVRNTPEAKKLIELYAYFLILVI